MYRLMQSTSPEEVGRRLSELCSDPIAMRATKAAIAYLDELFRLRNGVGVEMARRALRRAVDEEQVTALATIYTESMLRRLE